MPVSTPDYDDAVAVTGHIHWVGFPDDPASLHCNPYLLIDDEDVVLFDPGSLPHFPVVMRKVIGLVNPDRITYVVASHQDPDICSNIPVLEDVVSNPTLKVVAHGNTIRLIRHFGIQSDYYAVEDHDFTLTLRSGRELTFLFTPYLHSPGAIMTYDGASRTLFTSDVFGAFSQDWHLFAQGDFLAPMSAFHRIYMPSNALLSNCMARLERLDIDRILPQHGSILEGEQVGQAIRHLSGLKCGLDLMEVVV